MESYPKLQSLYSSGRYQCDLFFYSKLEQIANELNMYHHLQAIQNNKKVVERTDELTKKHLLILEQQDNEQKAIIVISEINKNLALIDTKSTKSIFEEVQRLGGKSYESKLIAYVKAQPFKKMYQEILQRIMTSVHDPLIRFQELLLVGLLFKNQDKVANFIQIYNTVLQNGVNQLRKFRQNFDFVKQNPQTNEIEQVKNYLKGTPLLLSCLFKFNQIYKVLSGDNKYGLKLNALKKSIQECPKQAEKSEEAEKQRPIEEFLQFLIDGTAMPNCCNLSLLKNEDGFEYKAAMKILYH